MNYCIDHLWIWIVLAFVVGVGSCSWYLYDPRGRNLAIAVFAPLLTLALGLCLYYGVDTDQKSIKRMLDTLIAAVEADDQKLVRQFISPEAENVQQLAELGMKLAHISNAKYHDLTIAVNNAASPTIAQVSFSATFRWKNKIPVEGFSLDQPFPENAEFEIELVKTESRSWHITNKFKYSLQNLGKAFGTELPEL